MYVWATEIQVNSLCDLNTSSVNQSMRPTKSCRKKSFIFPQGLRIGAYFLKFAAWQ